MQIRKHRFFCVLDYPRNSDFLFFLVSETACSLLSLGPKAPLHQHFFLNCGQYRYVATELVLETGPNDRLATATEVWSCSVRLVGLHIVPFYFLLDNSFLMEPQGLIEGLLMCISLKRLFETSNSKPLCILPLGALHLFHGVAVS